MKFVPRSEKTRQFIIESVAELFNKQGLAGTSITDIEKATGLTKGSVYGNFENKDALALEVLEYNIKMKQDLIQKQVDQCENWRQRLEVHVKIHFPKANAIFTPGGCPLQNSVVEYDDTNHFLCAKAGKGFQDWVSRIEAIIQGGKVAKEFKKDVDANLQALHIISLIEGASLLARAERKAEPAVKMLNLALEVIAQMSI